MVADGKVVCISYRLTDETGAELERTEKEHPLRYVHGTNTILRGLEVALVGLRAGEAAKITVPPGDAYGDFDADLRLEMDRSLFPSGAPLDVGELFRVTQPDGSSRVYVVEKVAGNVVTVNANHPLAGQTLRFDVKVLEVRDATDVERTSGAVAE